MPNAAKSLPSKNGKSKYAKKYSLPQKGSSVYELKKLRDQHHNILRLTALGVSQVDIAKALGCTQPMVSYTINSELGKQKLAALRREADLATIDTIKEMKQLVPLAVAVEEEILLDSSQKAADRLAAARDILDRVGPSRKEEQRVSHEMISQKEIEAARKIALDSAKRAGIIEDVEDIEFEDVSNSEE